MKEFSIYNSKLGIKQVTPTGTIDLGECADLIRSDQKLIQMTAKLRGIKDAAAKQKYKLLLPYVTFSGTFTKQATSGLLERSEYFMIDLDDIEDLGKTMFAIWDSHKPALMFISPRGNGLKVVFRIDPDAGAHEKFFAAFKKFFKNEFDLPIDEKCKNISRATFLCHDPRVFFTEDSAIFPLTDELTQYNTAVEWTDTQATFIEGERNQYITTLAGKCHRYGISEKFVNNQLAGFAEDGFTIGEIQNTVKSIYGNTAYTGIEKTCDYIRVGTSYYKKILKPDRQGIEKEELKVWNRNTIIEDHKRSYSKSIPKFDDFVMVPNNLEIQSTINNCYNLYSKFTHTPAPGEWEWTKYLMEHIFGEQYTQGLRYMQILYLHPERSTVILAIVSRERGTGKTTFVNWINMLFDANVALITPNDFISSFNASYATKNIICIEETAFEKKLTTEKLKDLATAKHIQINEKFVSQYKIPFYGKVILTSNNEERFAQIDEEEIRFLVRKVGMPEHTNHAIENNLLAEIPAFLDHLKSLPPVDWSVSRSGFTREELMNEALHLVVEESKSTLYKDLEIIIIDFFDNNEDEEFFFATPTNFKIDYFFSNNNNTTSYISRVLRKEFKMEPEKVQRYTPFNTETEQVGRPYCFHREDFVTCYK